MLADTSARGGSSTVAQGARRSGMSGTMATAALAALLLLSFSLFTFVSPPAGDGRVDRAVDSILAWGVWSTAEPLLNALALLGDPLVSAALSVVLAAAMAVRGRVLAAALVLAMLALFTGIELLLRLRLEAVPWGDVFDVLLHPRGRGLQQSTYPSGHVGRLVLIGGMALACLPRRYWLPGTAMLLLLGLITTIQRVQANTHTGSDGIGGLLLAGGLAAAFAVLSRKSEVGGRTSDVIGHGR